MNKEMYFLFVLQVSLIVVIYLLAFKNKKVPKILKFLVIIAYITVPVAIIVKGVASAIYTSDLIAPLLIFYFLKKPQLLGTVLVNRYFLVLSALLMILPFACGIIIILSGDTILDTRGWLVNGIWFYRNFIYLLVFGIGLSLKLNGEQVKDFIEINLGFGALLAFLGLVNYFGPFNMAVFDTIKWGGIIPEWYQESRIGFGFLGLFRGSVGQWFTVLVLLSIGAYYFVSPRFRMIALIVIIFGVGVILLSFSRIGLMGLIVGLVVLSLSMVKKRRRTALFAALFALTVVVGLGGDIIKERFFPRIEQGVLVGFGEAAVQRVLGWEASVEYFSDNIYGFLIGILPANQEKIFKIIGMFGPHNEYLDVIFRMGILGLVVMLWFILIILLKFLWVKSRVESFMKPVIWSLIAIIIANVVMALTQSHLLHDYATHTLGFYIYLLYGVFIGVYWNKQTTNLMQKNQERIS